MDKDSQNAIIDYNSKKFKLKELSEEANIEIVYDGKDEIVQGRDFVWHGDEKNTQKAEEQQSCGYFQA